MKARSVRVQAVMMIALTAIAQLCGILRISRVGATFGASREYDAFAVTLTVASAVAGLLSTAVGSVIIPALAQGRDKRGTDTFLTSLCVAALGLAGMTWILTYVIKASALMEYVGSYGYAILSLTPIIASSQALTLVAGTAVARLQVAGVFAFPQLITTAAQVCTVSATWLDPHLTVQRYALWIVMTTMVMTATQLWLASRSGAPWTPRLALRDPRFRALFVAFIPTAVANGVSQLSLVVDSLIASSLGAGNATLLAWSSVVASALGGILLTPLSAMSMPSIAAAVGRGTSAGIRAATRIAAMRSTVAMLSVTMFVVAGYDVVSLVYLHGRVTEHDVSVVTWCAIILVSVLPLGVVRDVLYQLFIAHRDTVTPFKNGVSASAVNLIVSVVLSIPFGVYGVVAGTAITALTSTAMILVRAQRRWAFLTTFRNRLLAEGGKLIVGAVCSVAMVMIVFSVLPPLPAFIDFALRSAVSLLASVAFLSLLGSGGLRLVLPVRLRGLVRGEPS